LTFTATVDPFNTIVEGSEGNNSKTVDKSFGCRRAPLVMGVPIDYSADRQPGRAQRGLGEDHGSLTGPQVARVTASEGRSLDSRGRPLY
jgi:hypothetical protein